jgi:hypothetical protein
VALCAVIFVVVLQKVVKLKGEVKIEEYSSAPLSFRDINMVLTCNK